jgi:outer membrane scaffolding protein for murein synthesis (MipA/OmpV family)
MQKNSKIIFLKNLGMIVLFTLTLPVYAKANVAQEIAQPAKKPTWEAGALLATFYGPLYPGADKSHGNVLPVPFVIYRGERLRIGENGVIKAVAVEKPRFKVDLSLGAAFNASSDDSAAREGMPDLDFIFEVGPEVSFMLGNSAASETWLNLQFRKVFSSDFSSIDDRGYIFQPEVSFQGKQLFNENDSFKFTLSPIFATKKTHQYFYQVNDEFSTAERPAYQAKGGYLGTEITLVNRFEIRHDISIFVSTKLGFYSGASNEDSPLLKEEVNYALGLGVKWTLFERS